MSDRRGIVTIPFGKRAGEKLVVARGASARIGRDPKCDLVLDDRRASTVHCELAWDGEFFFARDLESAAGTLVQGEPVGEEGAYVRHGGLVEIGDTSLVCYRELQSFPREPVRRRHKKRYAAVYERLAYEVPFGLYAVLDSARTTRVREVVRESVDEARSLYDGLGGDVLEDVAPFLVRFSPESNLLRTIVEEGWGDAWGIFIASPAPFAAMRRHLRRFTVAEVEETLETLYFRFYDPRVLSDFLEIATPRQRSEMFAEVSGFFLEKYDRERGVFDLILKEAPSGPSGAFVQRGAGGGDVSHP